MNAAHKTKVHTFMETYKYLHTYIHSFIHAYIRILPTHNARSMADVHTAVVTFHSSIPPYYLPAAHNYSAPSSTPALG